MSAIGFNCVKERWKVGGRMGYWLYHKPEEVDPERIQTAQFTKKTELRGGSNRNNFSILL
jgi:25S rRNA (adenine2142-N1)-methyltransferase